MGPAILISVLLAFLGAAFYMAFSGWTAHGDVEMSSHGWIAMVLGIVFSLVIGCGLMALVFISSRRGHDDVANRSSRRDAEH